MENEIKWEVVEELSDEDGTPNCWAHKLGPCISHITTKIHSM